MDLYNQSVSALEIRGLPGAELLKLFENARDSSVQLEIIGTLQEKIVDANLLTIRDEVLRRLNMVTILDMRITDFLTTERVSAFTNTRGHAHSIIKKILWDADHLLDANPALSVNDFVEIYTVTQFWRIPGLGEKSIDAVIAVFNAAGITLRQTT